MGQACSHVMSLVSGAGAVTAIRIREGEGTPRQKVGSDAEDNSEVPIGLLAHSPKGLSPDLYSADVHVPVINLLWLRVV